MSDTYTHGHHESVLRSHTWRTVENSAAYLIPHLRPGLDVLDVGCGPGTISCDLATRIAPGQLLGIDVAEDVISTAEATRVEWGADNATFSVASIYELEHDDDTFDVVHAHQVLQHLSDPVRALSEMRRVVKPDGVVAVRDADYAGMSWAPEDARLDKWLEVYRAVARRNDAEPDAARYLLRWARASGFSKITPSADAWLFADDALRSWWGSLWAARVTQSALAEQAVEYSLASPDDLEEIAEGFRQWAASPDGWFLVPNGELILKK